MFVISGLCIQSCTQTNTDLFLYFLAYFSNLHTYIFQWELSHNFFLTFYSKLKSDNCSLICVVYGVWRLLGQFSPEFNDFCIILTRIVSLIQICFQNQTWISVAYVNSNDFSVCHCISALNLSGKMTHCDFFCGEGVHYFFFMKAHEKHSKGSVRFDLDPGG